MTGTGSPDPRRAATDRLRPLKIGRYTVLEELGRGGMGSVLAARDEQLDRKVALKLLHAELADRHARRLVREAKALAKLSHPNVVQVYEVARDRDRWFIAMELVSGQTLRRWSERRPSWRECVAAYRQAGAGLGAAHTAGLTHRDFKPDNCIIDDEGRARVLDFGLVHETDEPRSDGPPDEPPQSDDDGAEWWTKTGAVMGTPAYMSPEQMQGQRVDARSDQFSFCVSLYEALYGERPFWGPSIAALATSMLEDRVRPAPRGAAVPEALRRVLVRGLSCDPEQRWSSMGALLAELERLAAPRVTRWWVASATIVGVGLLAGGLGISRLAEVQDRERRTRCTEARTHLEGRWDPATRDSLDQTLRATGRPFAADTAARVTAGLDAYAERWVEQRTAVCEATRVHGEQSELLLDVRMRCLDRRLSELSALLRVLESTDEETISRAVAAVALLRRPEGCTTALPGADDALPEDPTQHERFWALEARLDGAAALTGAGRYPEARDEASAVGELAAQHGFRSLLAQARVVEGTALRRLREPERAVAALREGILIASELGAARTELRGWTALFSVTGMILEEPERAADWQFSAQAALHRAGTPADLQLMLTLDIGAVMLNQDRFDEATRSGEQALRIAEQLDGHGSIHHAQALNNLGIVAAKQADWALAEQRLRESHRLKQALFGPEHPEVIDSGTNLANVLTQRAQQLSGDAQRRTYDEAERLYQRSVELRERTFGPDSPVVARALAMLGSLQRRREDPVEARRSYERAVGIVRALEGVEADLARMLNNLALIERSEHDYPRAEALHREALALLTAKYGDAHLTVGRTRVKLCLILADTQRPALAVAECERARSIIEPAFEGRSTPLLTSLYVLLGEQHHALGHAAEAARYQALAEP